MSAPNRSPQSSRFSCLLVDDDQGFAEMLAGLVTAEGGEPTLVHSIAAARTAIARRTYDLVILDNRLPDGTGFEFHAQVARQCPSSLAVMITGAPELSQAVALTRNGLFDFLTKPVSVPDFTACLRRAKLRLRRPELDSGADPMAGDSPAMQEVVLQLRQAARHPTATVLLLGETGTGKDLAARMLHRLTYEKTDPEAPYVPLNCPNVPTDMFEAELFGSEKGSYTGSDRRRTGLVEAAEGGTLFLDEVAEIPLTLQAKLLRFLESREYRALGATVSRQFTGRLVAATNRSLPDEVRAGRFREDLMYRLDVFGVRLPPLRERLGDVDRIAETLLAQLCHKYTRKKPFLRPADFTALRGYPFPGNVRELRNLLERSLLRTPDEAPWLALDLAWLNRDSAPAGPVTAPAVSAIPVALPPAPTAPAPVAVSSAFAPPADRQLSPIDLQEYQLIAQALREEGGGIRRAASKLGLTHQALLRRLQKWPELRQAAASGE